MNLTMLLEMVAEGAPARVLIGDRHDGLTPADLLSRALAGADLIADSGARTVLYLGGNGPVVPVALFSASYADVPFLPLNYRLGDEQLADIVARQDMPLVITDTPERVPGLPAISLDEFMTRITGAGSDPDGSGADPESVAVLLMTSGTTAAPKSAVLRHRHLTAYVLSTVEFLSAGESDATLVSVPPYHIAAVANLISNLFAGRRIVYLDHFTAAGWLDKVTSQGVTHAMVVPTMLVRIVEELKATGRPAPTTLRSVSYGGAKIPPSALGDALTLFPDTGFVNAYGLTETASSIAVLGPEDHRDALASDDAAVQARLGSVGRALPGVEIEVHDSDGNVCPPGVVGSIVVRGPQVAGEYLEGGSRVDGAGWFPTRDEGYIDEAGFIFVQGRADDTIIRGGENIAPFEIENVLAEHEWVRDCAVAGVPDEEWGQRIAAFVVLKPGVRADADKLRDFARARLRSSRTPDEFIFVPELPTTPTGKVLRRELVATMRPVSSATA
jgi:acyl-CoA synthetase (AMP-forming)/AMP-acid ligase II